MKKKPGQEGEPNPLFYVQVLLQEESRNKTSLFLGGTGNNLLGSEQKPVAVREKIEENPSEPPPLGGLLEFQIGSNHIFRDLIFRDI